MDEIRDIDSEAWKELFFQGVIDLVPVLRCICEAARVEGPRRLLEQDVKDGRDLGGVIGCGNGLIRSRTSYSLVHIF